MCRKCGYENQRFKLPEVKKLRSNATIIRGVMMLNHPKLQRARAGRDKTADVKSTPLKISCYPIKSL